MTLKAVAGPTPSVIQELTSGFYRQTLPKVAFIGSSYVEHCASVSAGSLTETNRSWARWWHTLSEGAFNMDLFVDGADPLGRGYTGSNFGVSGESSTQILSRIPSVLARSPDVVVIQSGSNNIGSTSTVIADVKASIDAVYAAGALAVYVAITNRGSVSWASNQPQQAFRVNQEIEDYLKRTGRGVYVDVNAQLTDALVASGRPYTNALDSDGIHYNQYSGFMIGKALHQALTPLMPRPVSEISSIADVYHATDNPYGNITTNPFFTSDAGVGSADGTVGTGVTAGSGVAATSVGRNYTVERASGTGTAVASLEFRGPGLGNWQTVVCTPAAAAATSIFYVRRSSADLTTNIPPVGTWMIGAVDVSVSTFGSGQVFSGFRGLALRMDWRSAAASIGVATSGDVYSNSFALPNEAWTGRLYTAPFQIPAGADRLRHRVDITIDDNAGGTGTVRIGRFVARPILEPRTIWGF